MMALPALFPPLLINTVASSEQTGHLPEALKRFQFYESRMEILRKRIKSTLLYPTIVIAAGRDNSVLSARLYYSAFFRGV